MTARDEKVSGTFCGDGSQGAARKRFLTPFLFVLLAAVMGGAAALRLARLENRPMHCDEAVHAVKFGRLLEDDDYVYNPREYHGPSLNFLTLPIARLASVRKLTEISETHLRLLPAMFGIILVGLVWLLRDELGRAAALCAAVLTAVSPAMVFYSRYYIQEMLLVCFTFGAIVALWRYSRHVSPDAGTRGRGDAAISAHVPASPRPRVPASLPLCVLVLLGLCVGMMHASKETCVIPLFAMTVAAALTMGDLKRIGAGGVMLSGLVVVITAASVSALFFSSFLDNPRGVIDSLTTYFEYLGRASGEGSVGKHVQPWHYYFRILFWWPDGSGAVWTEAPIAALALVGLVAGVLGKGLKPTGLAIVRFLGVYTVLMTLVYSVLPYKTPWCALGFLHGMILLAGVGVMVLVRAAPGYTLKAVVIAVAVLATGHSAQQAWRASFVAYCDPNNPYVYAHTTEDIPLLQERLEQIAAFHPDGEAVHIQVICPNHDYWPLPWYLRGFRRVGWFSQVPHGPAAPLIITQPEMEPPLLEYLYLDQPPGQRHLYVPVPPKPVPPKQEDRDWQLRPHVPLRVYVRLDLWEAYRAGQAGQNPAPQSEPVH